MYTHYFFGCVSLVFFVSSLYAFPTPQSKEIENTGTLPLLIPDRIQMPSGAVLSSLQQQEIMAQDVKPQSVSQDMVTYLKSLVEILKVSYCTSVTQDGEWKCDYCQPQMTLLLHSPSTITNDFTGIIIREDAKKKYYLLFPGTKSIQNIVTDIEFASVDYDPVGEGTKIHKGMYDSYLTKQNLIQQTMLDEMSKNTDYEVIVLGHSLGGGIANIVVLDLYQRNKYLNAKNLHLVTAGSPAMWNQQLSYYAASTDINMIRLTENNDIVAGTTDMLKITHFVQSGMEYWIQETGSVVCCQSRFETPNCINTRSLHPLKVTTAFSDHVMYFGERISQCGVKEPLTDPHQIYHIFSNL